MDNKVTYEEEMKIRETWVDYVMLRGTPTFYGGTVKLPSINKVTPFSFDAEISLVAVKDHYTYTISYHWRACDFPVGMRYRETTIECEGVIVVREWTRDE